MRLDREVKRLERIRADSPKRIAATAAFIVGFLALYWWWSHWFVLVLLAFQAFIVVMEGIIWLDALRKLAHPHIRARKSPVMGTGRSPVDEREDPELGGIDWRSDEESWCQDIIVDG